MELYYKTRTNKYLFDVQKGFAKAMGRKFLNLKINLDKKNDAEKNKDKKDDRYILKRKNNKNLDIIEENVELDKNDNALDIKEKVMDENEIKEQKEIADMYNNPNFMELGCPMQLYQQVIEDKINLNLNKEEDKKQIILLKDKI